MPQTAVASAPVDLGLPPELPISSRADDIESAIRDHQVVVVAGETGSGKTTQLPKICLRLGRTSIAHTQPRRIAARSVAERIAAETKTEVGDLVGYQVRFTRKASARTRLKVMTDGVLLAEIAHDRHLRRYDTIIIDEAHERSLNIDFLLGYLKQLLPRRPELKVIITSATIDTARFAEHFGSAAGPAPIIEVTGRNYPVEVRYRPLAGGTADDRADSDDDVDQAGGIARAVEELVTELDGDVLVFLSGEREIRDAAESIERLRLARTEVLPLYARLSSAEQHRVFSDHPGRRIVLSTNVAETSLTVPGIRAVVDAGMARISRYSARTKVQRLPIEPISQASANQRAGRCGRLGPGVCIRLYSEEDLLGRPEYTEPEILRTSLASVILQMASADLGAIASFPFVEAPDGAQITDGLRLLDELGALKSDRPGDRKADQQADEREDERQGEERPGRRAHDRSEPRAGGPRLTGLGRKLARIPLDPRMGRMLLAGERQGCLSEMMIIVAGLSVQDPRERPVDQQQAADTAHRRFWGPATGGAGTEEAGTGEGARRPAQGTVEGGTKSEPAPESEGSDFLAILHLWDYLREQRTALSGNAFRRMCRSEFLHFLRIREWQDLHAQLRQIGRDLELDRNAAPAAPDRIHAAILTGLLSQVGLAEIAEEKKSRGASGGRRRGRPGAREYQGARGTRFAINPGSSVAKIQPPLVMSAEIVETSRLWARTVAGIDVAQIEEVGAHLLKRSYSEPHWSSRSGSVMAYEQISLYGIPIVAGRRVGYGRIDPVLAREIFIRSALVEGDWRTRHHFFAQNQQLRADVEGLEDRVRRRDVVVDDQVIFDFYAARIPVGITSAGHFDAWWKTARHETPGLLDLGEDDLVADDGSAVRAEDFPDRWTIGELELDVSYSFEPGSERDGVSVQVPLAFLERLEPAAFSWQLPGFRGELATELIRSLPKARRTAFVPAPEYARRALVWIDQQPSASVEPFAGVLGRALRALTGDIVPEDEWRTGVLPGHLRPTFVITETTRDGVRVLAEGKDLDVLQRQLLDRSTASLNAAARQWTRTGLARWEFGEVPAQISLDRAGQPAPAFPHLVDEQTGVGLAVATSAASAARQHRAGLIRLVLLNTPDPTRWVVSHLSNANKLALGAGPYHDVPALLADARWAAAAELVDRHAGAGTREPAAFARLVDLVRAEQAELMRAVVDLVAESLLLWSAVRRELGTLARSGPAAAEDMTEQTSNLVFDRFASAIGYPHLVDVPRYLRAVQLRIGAVQAQPGRDAAGLAVILESEDRYAALCARQPPGPLPADVEAIAWMLEELRVGLFAQSLKTRYPISAKRIRTAITAAER